MKTGTAYRILAAGATAAVMLSCAEVLAGASFTQEHYRWRNDNGSESTATWKTAGPDAAISDVARYQNIRLRLSVANTGTIYSGSLIARLEYATSTNGTWMAVSAETNGVAAFEMMPTTGYTNGQSTTALLVGSGTFVGGKCVEYPSNTGPSVSYAVSQYSNFEYCFRATAKAQGGTTYYFRVNNDGAALTAYSRHAALTMEAGEANEPPAIGSALTAKASILAPFSYMIGASGSEPITYGASGLPAGLSFDGTNRIMGRASAVGVYDVELTASNAWGVDSKTLVLTVVADMPPTASNQTASVVEAGETQIRLNWSDIDTPRVMDHTFSIVTGPSHGTVESRDLRDGTVGYADYYYYRADAGSVGSDSFTWKCADSCGESGIATCSITITTNTVPVANNYSGTLSPGSAIYLTSMYTDPNSGQSLEIQIVTPPSHGRILGTTYYADWGYFGSDSFTWRVTDGVSTSNVATASITMNSGAPVAKPQSIYGLKNTTALVPIHHFAGTAHDIVAIATNASNGTVSIVGNQFQYVPKISYVGRDSFVWSARNEYGTNLMTCNVHVFEDASWLVQKEEVVRVGASRQFEAFFTSSGANLSGDPAYLDITVVSGPEHGSVKVTGATGNMFTYTPAPGYRGTDRFVWEADESLGVTNRAVCELIVRDANDRAGMLVLLVVNNTLMPEITNEVARLKQDLENEGYTSKIVGEPPPNYKLTSLERLWWHLKKEYSVEDRFMAGAMLLGYMGGGSAPIYDLTLRHMQSFDGEGQPSANQIWVTRTSANGAVGRGYGSEVALMKRYLDANHECRTGTARLPHTALDYAIPEFAGMTQSNALSVVWPEVVADKVPVAAFGTGGDIYSEISHGNFLEYGMGGDNSHIDCADLFNSICEVRSLVLTSCSIGGFNGIAEQHLFTRLGGAMRVTWGWPNLNSPNFQARLLAGDSWGSAMVQGPDDSTLAWYGDYSMPVMMHPHNDMPVISSAGSDVTSGPAPLSVTLSCSASDPDGSVAKYEWFAEGYNYGRIEPTYVTGAGTASVVHIYALPHQYQARVQAIDNYKAATYKLGPAINVGPQPGEPIRVNCGYKTGYYTPGADYTDTNGCLWLHDQLYAAGTWGHSLSSGQGGSSGQDVIGTDDDLLYQYWRRRSTEIPYRVPLSNGDYTLRLGFADMTSTSALQRVMDIAVEGTNRVTGLDVFAEVGAKTVKIVELPVTVTDGELNLTVRKNAAATAEAILNCFEVIPAGWAPEAPVITSSLTASAIEGQPFSYTISASGSQPIGYDASGLPAGLWRNGAVIAGYPAAQGAYGVTLTAANMAGSDTKTLVLTVNGAAADNDMDGIPDDTDPDDDNDGMSDVDEAVAGTDHLDPDSRFKVSRLRQGYGGQAGVILEFDSVSGRVYGVYCREDLLIGQWLPLNTNIGGTGNSIVYIDSSAGARRFYRLKVRLP